MKKIIYYAFFPSAFLRKVAKKDNPYLINMGKRQFFGNAFGKITKYNNSLFSLGVFVTHNTQVWSDYNTDSCNIFMLCIYMY